MAMLSFLAVCFIVCTAVARVNGKCSSTYHCDDMQHGGIDQPFDKPSIHLIGRTAFGHNRRYYANQALGYWNTPATNASFMVGGMKYSNGEITVPYAGIYFMYCQLYYRTPNEGARHRIHVNGRRVAEAGNQVHENTQGSYYTGVAVKLNAGDKISCRLRFDSNLWDGDEHTFIGAFLQ